MLRPCLVLVCVLLAACGSDPGSNDDAGLDPDAAAIDAADPDPDAADPDGMPPDPEVLPDPAPTATTPGEHTGAGCPDGDETVFTASSSDSVRTFAGTITGFAENGAGSFWVRGAAGERISGAMELDQGSYDKTLPLFCGANVVKLVWNNGTCPLAQVFAIERTDCEVADITATLQWSADGLDWELHLIKPGGRLNDVDGATDCTWTTCVEESPDWGVIGDATDDPRKDLDNSAVYGPENTWLHGPEAGTYTVMVEHWNTGAPTSDGSLILNVAGETVVIPRTDLASHHVWTAATIEWPSGVVTPMTTDYDCDEDWLSGCRAELP